MRYTLLVVEQLDRAARELFVDHPINNRLALILVDNATELILHRRYTDKVNLDRMRRRLDPRHRALAAGKFIDGKLKVLEAFGEISQQERQFISAAHQYRNELYHVGLTHDEIIRSISCQYFKLCCELFERLKPAWRTQSSTDRFTEVAERYLERHNGHIDFMSVDNAALAEKLLANLRDDIEALPYSLSTSARASIEAVEEAFDFLVRDNPGHHDREAILRKVQWHLDFTHALDREGIDGSWMDPGYMDEVQRVRTALEANWRQRHTSVPTAKWLKHAEAIDNEPDPLKAMSLHQTLCHDMAYLEEAIMNAASELDAWIQLESDRARGK